MNIVLLWTMMVSSQCCENKSRSFPKDVKACLSIHFLFIGTCYQGHRNTPTIVLLHIHHLFTFSYHGQFRVSSQPNADVFGLWWEETGPPGENPVTKRTFKPLHPEARARIEPRTSLLTTVKLSFFKWPLWDETNKINTTIIALKLFF